MKNEKGLNLAYQKPTRASNENPGHSARMGNDKDEETFWQADSKDGQCWWQIDLEAIRTVNEINILFPKTANYRYAISVYENGKDWEILVDELNNQLAYKYKHFKVTKGLAGRFIRVSFMDSSSKAKLGLAEIEIFGNW
jgi:hypothetical protein